MTDLQSPMVLLDSDAAGDIVRALDELVRRGVVTTYLDLDGVQRYQFPDRETGRRLLNESLAGGQ